MPEDRERTSAGGADATDAAGSANAADATGAQVAAGGGWVRVPVAPPEPGRMAAFEAGGRRLVLCNAEGSLYVIEDRCPHAGVALSAGRLRGCVLECPFHGGKLDVRDGSPVAPPIRRKAVAYAVRLDAGSVAVALPPGA